MSSSASATLIARSIDKVSRLLDLPLELRSSIYDFAFCVDHINAIQRNTSSSNKGNNKYETLNDTYSMTSETRDCNIWRNGSQSLSTFLALTRVCRQVRAEIAPLAPFSRNVFDVGFHAIQHFLAVVPRAIRDDIKVISLWKWPGKTMSCVGDMQLAGNGDKNDRRVWMTLIGMLRGLPSLERVFLNVRGGVHGLGYGANWQPQLQTLVERVLERLFGRKIVVEMV
jgi:hypothetical protein